MSMPPRVIIAARNGARIAQANPDAVVIDVQARAFRRGDVSVAGSISGKLTDEFKISAMLCAAAGNLVEYYEIIDGLWHDDPTGGPIDPLNVIRQYLPSIKRRLLKVGIDVSVRWGIGLDVASADAVYLAAAE